MERKEPYKYTCVKKIDTDALIIGFPFNVFFITLGVALFYLLLFMSAPTIIGKIVVGVLGVLFIGGLYYVYVSKGLKTIMITVGCFFRNITGVKMKGDIQIRKLNLTEIEK